MLTVIESLYFLINDMAFSRHYRIYNQCLMPHRKGARLLISSMQYLIWFAINVFFLDYKRAIFWEGASIKSRYLIIK